MRNVLVTGGSRGLGLGIAQALAVSGYRVISVARRETTELAAAIEQVTRSPPGALHFCAFDLANVGAMSDLIKSLSRKFGAFYGLVNNAALGTSGILANMPDREIERQVC